jgi:hypothetical protein
MLATAKKIPKNNQPTLGVSSATTKPHRVHRHIPQP